MRSVNLASFFLAISCCSAVLSVEIIKEKPANDLLKFSMTSRSKLSAKRRFRRNSKEDHPDIYNANKGKGACIDPTQSGGRQLQTFDVSLSHSCFGHFACMFYVLCLLKMSAFEFFCNSAVEV